MKRFILLAMVAATFLIPLTTESAEKRENIPVVASKDINGWGEAKWGMTESEILEIFQGKVAKQERKYYFADDFADTVINNIEIGEFSAKAEFIMNAKTNKLSAVKLSLNKKGDNCKICYEKLRDLLTAKYGEPPSKDKREYDTTTSEWIFQRTKIEIHYAIFPRPMPPLLWIVFKEISPAALENL